MNKATATNKPVVIVKEKGCEMVYKLKGSNGIGLWVEKKDIAAFGLAIAVDIAVDRLERFECWSAWETAQVTRKAMGL